MLKLTLIGLLSFLGIFGIGSDRISTENVPTNTQPVSGPGAVGTIEKLAVSGGGVRLDVDLGRLQSGSVARRSIPRELEFGVGQGSMFTLLVFNDEMRGPLPGSIPLMPGTFAGLPGMLGTASERLVVESTPFGSHYELVIRDGETGFTFFNIEGHQYSFDTETRGFTISDGRILISEAYAAELGRPDDAGALIGSLSITATTRPLEITQVVDGEIQSSVMPASTVGVPNAGPDVIVGDLNGLSQFGSSSGTRVGLAVGTDSCNIGTVDLNWFALPNNDHPVIPQNLYRMSANADRFEQIGQSSVKHAFTALTENLCDVCNNVGGTHLGVGCSDPYSASLNAGPNLGSRAWINPFSGFFPRSDSATPPNTHTGHTHAGPTHRILTEIADLNTTLNAGSQYFAEAQYVTPHEYQWCQSNPTECNMYNNVSYRRYSVSGTASPFSFSPVGSTQRVKRAVEAWTGATVVPIHPAPGADGTGLVAYKVTNPSAGVWHYEYAVYNETLDRAIQSFSIPLDAAVTVSNIGFRAPPQHPGMTFDGTVGNTGFSSTPWAQSQNSTLLTWSSETLAQNPNANAIRWGTMYNFRFDSNSPPQAATATVGFFKTGAPITVQVMGPIASGMTPTPTPTASPTATATATPTATASPTPSGCQTVTLNPSTLPDGIVGAPYSQTITATGIANTKYTYVHVDSTLPPGLSIDAQSGTLSGTSPTAGTFSFRIQATAQNGCIGRRDYTINIAPSTAEVGGVVVLSNGRGLRANVVLTEANGTRRTIETNSFGFFAFSDVPRNQMITVVARASRYRFAAQQMMVTGNMPNVNFTALE
ncbi:MAG: Ig domain-containing protein [Pyrinomonadaceae bacterium]